MAERLMVSALVLLAAIGCDSLKPPPPSRLYEQLAAWERVHYLGGAQHTCLLHQSGDYITCDVSNDSSLRSVRCYAFGCRVVSD